MSPDGNLDGTQRKTINFAYSCYLFILLCFAVASGIEVIFGSPESSEEFAVYQGVGMLVLLPLSMAAIVAAFLGAKSSFRLRKRWTHDRGLLILPLLLLVLVAMFFLAEEKQIPAQLLWIPTLAYCIAALYFSVRWFTSAARK